VKKKQCKKPRTRVDGQGTEKREGERRKNRKRKKEKWPNRQDTAHSKLARNIGATTVPKEGKTCRPHKEKKGREEGGLNGWT